MHPDALEVLKMVAGFLEKKMTHFLHKFQNCRENPNSRHERKCQMVTEKICQLKRNDKFTDEFEMKKVVKCHKEQGELNYKYTLHSISK